MNREQNEQLVRVGAETKTGQLFRRYWIPACLSEELGEADSPPIKVRLLGEDLVAFRDTSGVVGLVDAYCPHRRVNLYFGRNEEHGLRCVFHGWKFDREGRCLEIPSEPATSKIKDTVRLLAYPTYEAGGIVWTYMGPPEKQPPYPDYEFLRAPSTHRFASKTLSRCNYLQSMEAGFDTAHTSFLHNEDIKTKEGLRSRDGAPKLEVEKTPYGYRSVGTRDIGDDGNFCRVYHYVMPSVQIRGLVTEWASTKKMDVPTVQGHIWVPIDDENCWAYFYMYGLDESVVITPEWAEELETWTGRGKEQMLPGYELKQNSANDYWLDRDRQKGQSFSGIPGLNTQDIAVTESMGRIVDRSKEHLGSGDRMVATVRQLLLEGGDDVAEGKTPKGANPADYRLVRGYDSVVPKGETWRSFEHELTAKW